MGRWKSGSNSCEVNWLDPEPDRESSGYKAYIRELHSIQDEIFCFQGIISLHQKKNTSDYAMSTMASKTVESINVNVSSSVFPSSHRSRDDEQYCYHTTNTSL